jgi:peptide/nickel transport system substrate-binding protein
MNPGLKSFSLFLLFALLIILVPANGDAPNYGGSVVIAISTDPGGLNPAITTQGGVHLVCASIFSGLVSHDFDLNPVPDLAEKWEVAPDGHTYTFHLNKGATFHDGAPVTSEDVKFTFEQLLMKYHSRARTSIGGKLSRILTPDPHTVVFEFGKPYAAFLQLVDVTNAPVMPKHLFDGTDPLTSPHNVNPVGSGAFKFQEWAKGDHVTLVKNETYFKPGKPHLDRVVFKVMPSATTAEIAFENGEADFFMNPAPLDTERLRKTSAVVVTDKGRQGYATVETLIPNLARAPLSNLKVRQAIAHSIDKEYIAEKVFFGQSVAATGPVSRLLSWAYNPGVAKYERDVALANRLLDEAGYGRGGDGMRFHLKIVYASGWAKVVEALKDGLNEAGIALDLELMEFSAMVDRIYVKKDFDLGFSSFENGPDPDIGVKRTVVSTNIGPIPFSNGAGYRNPHVDELFELASSETNKQKRTEYYFEAQDVLVKDLAYFWLYEPRSSAVYDAALRGVYEWSAKSNLQFASDAWWSDLRRADQRAAGASRRWWRYALAFLVVVAIAGVVFVFARKKRPA